MAALDLLLNARDGNDFRTGQQDATEILQAMIDGTDDGELRLPSGTFLVSLRELAAFPGYHAALTVPPGMKLTGAGEHATTLLLAPGQAPSMAANDGVSIMYNTNLGGGDVGIEVADLTVDGNAANQGTATHNGITFVRTRGARCSRVTVKNVRGQGNSPPNESFHFDTQLGIGTRFTDCTAIGESGDTASGFSANNATGIHYAACTAHGMTYGMGFTHYQCDTISHTGCHAYRNGDNGFNSEESQAASWSNCHAGGQIAPGSSPWPHPSAASLGNAGAGFIVNGTRNAVLTGCTSRRNSTGLGLVEGTNGASGRISSCAITDNAAAGISASNPVTVGRWQIDNASIVDNNNGGSTEFDLPTGWTAGPGNQLTTPDVPADGVALANPYPFAVTVHIIKPGTINLLRVNGADIDTSAKTVRLLPGMTVTVFYSAAPSWLWFAD